MNTQPKPTWITLVSLSAMCAAAFFFLVPLLPHPIEQAIATLIISVALFDVVALWITANWEALEREFSPQNHKDTPYRHYGAARAQAKKKAPKKSNTRSDDDQKDS